MADDKLIRSSYFLTIIGFFCLNLLPPFTFIFAFCTLSIPLYLTLAKPERFSAGDPSWMSDAISLEDLMKFNSFSVLGYITKFSISGSILLWLFAIVASNLVVVFLWLFFIPVRRYKPEYRISVFMLVIFALYAVGDLGLRFYSNYETAVVTGKRESSAQIKGAAVLHYVAEVVPENPLSNIKEVKVNSEEYSGLYEGQMICLKSFSSWIHQSWVGLYDTSECPTNNQ